MSGQKLEQHWHWKGGRGIVGGKIKYLALKALEHPKAYSDGRILEHRIIAERALGHPLPIKAEVHHVNGNGLDNSNNNLVICENKAYHMFLHKRILAFSECDHGNWFKCSFCHKYDLPENLVNGKSRGHYHRSCYNEYQRKANYKSYHKNKGESNAENRS